MAKAKMTIPQFQELKKKGQKFRMITSYDYPFAAMVDKTPIEMILVGDSLGMTVLGYDSTVPVTMEDMLHHIKPVVKGAPNTFIVGDMPFGSYNESISQGIHNANRMMKEAGADCVKLEGGATVVELVREMVKAGIPVMGHIGLTPQTAAQLGGFKVQGKNEETARKLIQDAKLLEEAGAFSIVLECLPAVVGKMVTEQVPIPTIGIGAGPYCDAQVLVIHDVLGIFDKFTPKFVKKYAELNGQIIAALNTYAKEVQDGTFPDEEHSFGMKEEEIKKLY